MKYCRFLFEGQIQYGRVEDSSGEPWIVETIEAPEEDLAYRVEHGHHKPLSLGFEPLPLRNAALLAPVTPSKIVCVGRNYAEHVKELGNELPKEPLLFFKPISSLIGSGGVIKLPKMSERIDFEGELGLVIGKRAHRLSADGDWKSVIRGCTLANDVSARDLQKRDVQFTRAKGFDTFCPVGPVVSDELDLSAPQIIETRQNGEVRQHGSTANFIFALPILLAAITHVMTLEPGDLILTGTPEGVAPMRPGDRMEMSMAGIGSLLNTVEADAD